MIHQAEILHSDPRTIAEAIVNSLPVPDYTHNYQPTYLDEGSLVDAVAEMATTTGVTNPRQVDAFSERLAAIADESSSRLLVITGSCRETIQGGVGIAELGEAAEVDLAIIASSKLHGAVIAHRGRGQYKKPRSSEIELVDGIEVPAYMGDLINGQDPKQRTPDPSRLVAGGVQARDLEEELRRRIGAHVPATHEALSLPYEKAFIRKDPATGRDYSLSGDLLWAGVRTNQLNGEIVETLAGIENPVGVKIGANSDESHIAGLAETLNPNQRAGKLVYMLRLGVNEAGQYPTILGAIRKHAPGAITIFDIHGTTEKLADGTKIRHVGTAMRSMSVMAEACREAGVKFGGVHLETTPDGHRLECIDTSGELPRDDGDIDPRLNPRQTRQVLDAVAALV